MILEEILDIVEKHISLSLGKTKDKLVVVINNDYEYLFMKIEDAESTGSTIVPVIKFINMERLERSQFGYIKITFLRHLRYENGKGIENRKTIVVDELYYDTVVAPAIRDGKFLFFKPENIRRDNR